MILSNANIDAVAEGLMQPVDVFNAADIVVVGPLFSRSGMVPLKSLDSAIEVSSSFAVSPLKRLGDECWQQDEASGQRPLAHRWVL